MAFTFSSTSGSSGETTITVSATTNSQHESLVAQYVLSNASGYSVAMPITQKAAPLPQNSISLSPSSMTFTSKGGRGSITVTSNDKWSLVSSEWISLASKYDKGDSQSKYTEEEKLNYLYGSGNTIIGIVIPVNNGSYRTGGITATCSSDTSVYATSNINQLGGYVEPYITVTPKYMEIGNEGGATAFTVSSNTAWTASTDTKWMNFGSGMIGTKTHESSGNETVDIYVQENNDFIKRTGGIKVFNEQLGIVFYLGIDQMGKDKQYIDLSPDSFKVDATGSTRNEIRVSANCEYDITTDVGWIRLGSLSGSGDMVLEFETTSGEKVDSNTGIITFSNEDISTTAYVTRSGVDRYLSASTTTIRTSHESSHVETVDVYSNVDWNALTYTKASEWLGVSPSSGSGNGTITVNIRRTDEPKTGSVIIENMQYGLKWEIIVEQV